MDILVTGAAGFLGSNLSEKLLKDGHNVWGVDNLLTGTKENVEGLLRYPNFDFFKCGIEEKAFSLFCDNVGVKFDQIFELACATGVPNIERLSEEMLLACSIGTWNTLEVARKHGSKFILTSSSEVYGEPLVTPQAETYTGNVETTGWRASYEEGKRFAETIVSHFVRKYGVHATIVRLFNAYGPNMALEDTRVISRCVVSALKGGPLPVTGDGSQRRTFCFVSDIIDGLEIVIDKGIPGEVYNLGSNKEITIRRFAEKIIELTGSESHIEFVKRPAHDHSARMPVLDKIHALGWSQKIPLDDGLEATIKNFSARILSNETSSSS